MKKRIAAIIFSGIFVLLFPYSVLAITSIASINPITEPIVIQDDDNYSYIFNFDKNALDVSYFELKLWYSDVHTNTHESNPAGEQWFVTQNDVSINFSSFSLTPDKPFQNTKQDFIFYESDLGSSLFSQFASEGHFALAFTETTDNVDEFTLNSATLTIYGTPAAVPIPGAMLLFGTGLLGLVGLRQRQIR